MDDAENTLLFAITNENEEIFIIFPFSDKFFGIEKFFKKPLKFLSFCSFDLAFDLV